MRTVPFLALTLLLCGLAERCAGQEPPKGPPPKPLIVYGQFRELMAEGKYDIAAGFLQAFLDSTPTDDDFLAIEKKYGTSAFTGLRGVPKWSDEPNTQKKARDNVEAAIKRATDAAGKLLRNPARVAKFIKNLGATYEERLFAEQELRRTGSYAVPFLVDELRVTTDPAVYAGILGAIKHLEPQTVAGWVAALDGFPPAKQAGIITAIASRPDALQLQTNAQFDLSPWLWRIMSQGDAAGPTLRALAEALLNKINRGARADTRVPEAELTALANTFYAHTARFADGKKNPDGSSTVPLWIWDAKDPENPRLTEVPDVPVGQAEEYYGLKYARWALEKKPDYEPAQGLVLSLAAERAVERSKFGNLAKAEPAVYKLLSDAPSAVLNDLLNRGLNQKKSALVLAMVQVLGDRADRDAATPPAGLPARPSLLVRALSYGDPQVQIAAAHALLRSPVPIPPAVKTQIVDVLRRAAADTGGTPGGMGTALIADPSKVRSDATAFMLRGLGYDVEVFNTGRDLLRRLGRASDFDLILIDRHIPNPELIDVVGQLQADVKAGNRPTFVMASTDRPRVPTFDQLVVRFAALIAATENDIVSMPPPYAPTVGPGPLDQETIEKERAARQIQRDGVFRSTTRDRIARLKRVVDSTGVSMTATQQLLFNLRVELVTYAILAAEFPLTPESAPGTYDHVARLRRQIDSQPASPPYGAGTPTTDLVNLMERFETDLARVPSAKKRFEELYARVDAVELGIPIETFRDEALEARVMRSLKGYPAVRVIPEPYSRAELATDLKIAQATPGMAPRDPAERAEARKTSVEWLRKMAAGELPGFDARPAEAELRAALNDNDLADAALDAVSRFGSAEAQQDLLRVSLNQTRPLPLRLKAADLVTRHIQANRNSIPKSLIDPLVDLAGSEADPVLRGKFLTLKGMIAHNPADFTTQLRTYNPPLLPPPPMPKEPPKEMEPKKD